MASREWMEDGGKQSGGNGEKGGTQKNKKRMVSRSKSRKTIGPCSSSAQASTFRRFPMSPLEQREGRSLWVMRGMTSVRVGGVVRAVVCICVCVCTCPCVLWVCAWAQSVERSRRDVEVAVLEWRDGWMDVLGGARRRGHRASLVPLSGFIQLLNLLCCR